MVWSGFYALHGANEDWNRDGQVELLLEVDCFEKGQDTEALVEALCGSVPTRCPSAASRTCGIWL